MLMLMLMLILIEVCTVDLSCLELLSKSDFIPVNGALCRVAGNSLGVVFQV